MTHMVIDEKLQQPQSHVDIAGERSKSPKLTMKFLYMLLIELKEENQMLLNRVAILEQKLNEYHQIPRELASTVEQQPVAEETEIKQVETDNAVDSEVNYIPRSIRHAKQKKSTLTIFLHYLTSIRVSIKRISS